MCRSARYHRRWALPCVAPSGDDRLWRPVFDFFRLLTTVDYPFSLNRKAGVEWSSFAHTGVDVPVFAQGAGAARFAGEYDNTNVAEKILSISSL